MPYQLALNLPTRAARGRASFFVSDANAEALSFIDHPERWPHSKLVLVGAAGTGKTHLAHVFAEATGADILGGAELAASDPETLADVGTVVVDNAQQVAGDAVGETILFHLHNLLAAQAGALLLTATEAPAQWDIGLPDLRSRLEAATVARLNVPDDALLAAVLVKLFDDRQIDVAPRIIEYLLPRMPRSLSEAQIVVNDLDRAALETGSKITLKIARAALDNHGFAST